MIANLSLGIVGNLEVSPHGFGESERLMRRGEGAGSAILGVHAAVSIYSACSVISLERITIGISGEVRSTNGVRGLFERRSLICLA
jgi:hypothetical protein